jgi:hypothetical protein
MKAAQYRELGYILRGENRFICALFEKHAYCRDKRVHKQKHATQTNTSHMQPYCIFHVVFFV